jgi:predicted TIM-barrel fold metal-dependent hydrolase
MAWHIDADAHVTEPPGVWIDRFPKEWLEYAPTLAYDEPSKEDRWVIGKTVTGAAIGGTASGFNPNPLRNRPMRFSEIPPMAWDAKARLEYMDSVQTWAQVQYPNVAGFGNQAFTHLPDEQLKLECVRAYNDWLHEWCSEDSRRLLPIVSTPFWDIEATVKEIERCAAKGFRGILFTGEPQRWGMPFFAERDWDPLWDVAQQTGLPISFHIGSGDMDSAYKNSERVRAMKYKSVIATRGTVAMLLDNAAQVTDFLLAGVLPRFPGLKVVSVESGAGWIPFVLESVDYYFETFQVSDDLSMYEDRPSEYFKRQMYSTFFFEEFTSQEQVEAMGVENLLFETDFPHPSCLYADNVGKMIDRMTASLTEETGHKILWENSAKLYGVDTPSMAAAR